MPDATLVPFFGGPLPPACPAPAVAAPGRVEIVLGRVYFVAADGARYRVQDAEWRDGRWRAHRPPHPAARFRIFVDGRGARRIFSYDGAGAGRDDARALEATLLARQLAAATSP